ncbi:MAG: isopeptide-forming domain-containing fimbrial protein, partial [Microthrixaceae bacterium]
IGGGQTGLPAGTSQSIKIGMRLPTQTAVANDQVISNTADVTASNADPDSSTIDVTAQIPVSLQPVATKQWSPGAGLAQSGAASTITIGARNASTSSSQVRELAVADASEATFDRFDLTSVGTLDRFPSGADQVVVELCPLPVGTPCGPTDWVASSPQSGATPLTLTPPPGVVLADATGVRYRYSNSGGSDLPFDIDDARVAFDVVLRDTLRSTDEPLNPTTSASVRNCATPAVVNATEQAAVGSDACATYVIQPGNATVGATKDIFADSNGDYAADGNVVVGQNSGVSMKITATNNSPYAVPLMAITEPSPSAISDFDKLDVTTARVTFPTGATEATLTVTCRSGANPAPVTLTAPPTKQSVTSLGCDPGVFPASVSVSFVGVTGGTTPNIAIKAAASLELHGTAAGVTTEDVTSGLLNCAETFIASNADSTGSSTADACDTQPVQNPNPSVGGGTKSSTGVSTIVAGQELDFELSFRNNGNIPVSNVVLADPPDPTAASNPFGVIRLTQLRAITASPTSVLEVYDPVAAAYVPYVQSDTALLTRATGIRVRVTGNLSPGQSFKAGYSVLLRDGQPTGVSFLNCASVGLDSPTTSPFCNGSAVRATTPGSGGSLNKSIVPGSVVRPQPGLPPQVITVKHAIQNTGSLYLKRLGFTDTDPDFFDAVVFKGNLHVNFPNGANRVQVDVCTSVANCAGGTFTNGSPTSSSSPGLPPGVTAADVKGIRVTFTNSNGGYEILPSPNLPSGGKCSNATFCFDAEVRQFLASSPTTPVPDVLEDISGGFGESELQPPGSTFTIPDVAATVNVVQGTPSLSIVKTPNSRIGPGDTAPFSITVTNSGTDAVIDPVVVDPLPAGLTFDPVTPGAPPGQAYTVQYVLPSGV